VDDNGFDALVRGLAVRSTRRSGLRALAGAGIGFVFEATVRQEAGARQHNRRRTCRPHCTVCQRCRKRKGTCRTLPDETACGPCHVCRRGKCLPLDDGTLCAECQVCAGGECTQAAADGTRCGGEGQCDAGTCVPRPQCVPASGASGCIPGSDPACCSGTCLSPPTLPGITFCAQSGAGQPCFQDSDCQFMLACHAFACK
jgi:hypothetical protein